MKKVLIAFAVMFATALSLPLTSVAQADEDGPRSIHEVVTKWNMVGSNATIGIFVVDDPMVSGVSCTYSMPDQGGIGNDIASLAGVQTEVSDISLSCRQTGPIRFVGEEPLVQGDFMFTEDRGGILFSSKEFRIVRTCDLETNTLIYMSYSTKLIDGSPKNSTSTVVIVPWLTASGELQTSMSCDGNFVYED